MYASTRTGTAVALRHANLLVVSLAARAAQHPATRPQAEATLLAFRNSQRPVAACQHILQHSRSLQARFQARARAAAAARLGRRPPRPCPAEAQPWLQAVARLQLAACCACDLLLWGRSLTRSVDRQAAVTLRDAAVREWPLLPPDARAALRRYVLQYVIGCPPWRPAAQRWL